MQDRNILNHIFIQFMSLQRRLTAGDGFASGYETYFHIWMDMASQRYRYASNGAQITYPTFILLRGFGDETTENTLSKLGAQINRRWLECVKLISHSHRHDDDD